MAWYTSSPKHQEKREDNIVSTFSALVVELTIRLPSRPPKAQQRNHGEIRKAPRLRPRRRLRLGLRPVAPRVHPSRGTASHVRHGGPPRPPGEGPPRAQVLGHRRHQRGDGRVHRRSPGRGRGIRPGRSRPRRDRRRRGQLRLEDRRRGWRDPVGGVENLHEIFNYFSKLDSKYEVLDKARAQLEVALDKVKKSDTANPETVEKIESALSSTNAKIKEINDEYDLVGVGMTALGVVGDLVEKAIVKAGELNEEYQLLSKAADALKEAVDKAKAASK